MNTRFESLIVGAVAIGALTLAGCSSGGGGGGGGGGDGGGGGGGGDTPGDSTVAFLGGRATAPDQLRLYFSDAVALPSDTEALAQMFTLNQTRLSAGILFNSHYFCGQVKTNSNFDLSASNTYYCASGYGHLWVTNEADFHAVYQPGSGDDAAAAITGISADPDDETRILLNLDSSIALGGIATDGGGGGKGLAYTLMGHSNGQYARIDLNGDDGRTGVLRLTYAGGTDGLKDSAGDIIGDAELPDNQIGNVGANSQQGPVLVAARTIDSTHVQLVFSEPVQIADGDKVAAAGNFTLTNNCLYLSDLGFQTPLWVGGDSGEHLLAPWTPTGSQEYFANPSFYSHSGSTIGSIMSASVSADAPNIVTLILNSAIPAHADNEGLLRLTYLPPQTGDGEITNMDGKPMVGVPLNGLHPGNVIDTDGDDFVCRLPYPG